MDAEAPCGGRRAERPPHRHLRRQHTPALSDEIAFSSGRLRYAPGVSRFPRYLRHQLEVEDRAKVGRIVAETETEPERQAAGATAGGDGRRLRGIPAVSRGTSGAVAGSDPVRALIAKESRRRG